MNSSKHTYTKIRTDKNLTSTRDGPVLTWRKGRLRLFSRAGPSPPGTGDPKPHHYIPAHGPPSGPVHNKEKTSIEHRIKKQQR
jgi:hypothetical protein